MENKTLFKNDKYEFFVNITADKNEIYENSKETFILVTKDEDIEKVFNSLNNTNKCSGLVTVSLLNLYDKFNNSGVWNYKHIVCKSLDKVKMELMNLKVNDIFLTFWCNNGSNLEELSELLEIVLNNNKELENWFSMPIVYEQKKDEYEIGVFYK